MSASTPGDFLDKVKSYMIDSATTEQPSAAEAEPDMSSSANQKSDSSHVTSSQPMKGGTQTQALKQTDSKQIPRNANTGVTGNQSGSSSSGSGTAGYQSAFKLVSRSNSQKKPSVFYVSQVSEDSLGVKKTSDKSDVSDTKVADVGEGPTDVQKS